jgi:hypothetical protein
LPLFLFWPEDRHAGCTTNEDCELADKWGGAAQPVGSLASFGSSVQWSGKGRSFMQASSKPISPSVPKDKQLPGVTFKNSLREWQARYKAQRAARGPAAGSAVPKNGLA